MCACVTAGGGRFPAGGWGGEMPPQPRIRPRVGSCHSLKGAGQMLWAMFQTAVHLTVFILEQVLAGSMLEASKYQVLEAQFQR